MVSLVGIAMGVNEYQQFSGERLDVNVKETFYLSKVDCERNHAIDHSFLRRSPQLPPAGGLSRAHLPIFGWQPFNGKSDNLTF